MEENMGNGKSYEEINDILIRTANLLNLENRNRKEKYNKAKDKYINYNPVTDRNQVLPGYAEAGGEYLGNSSEEALYDRIVVNNNLEQYFSKDAFREVYDYVRREHDTLDFEFSEYIVDSLITYNDFIHDSNKGVKGNDFEEYADNKEQQKRETERKQHEQEIREMQEGFVNKTSNELRDMYEKDKDYIDFKYEMFVSSHGLDNVIPFEEFLEIYDKADRDYSGTGIGIDGRIANAVVDAYYDKFNLEGKMDKKDFYAKIINPIHHGAEYRDVLVMPEALKNRNGEPDIFIEELEKMGVDVNNYEMNNMFENSEEEKEQENGLSL